MRTHIRRQRGIFGIGLILAGLFLGSSHEPLAFGQAPGNPPGGREAKKIFTNRPVFHLPVKLDEKYRIGLSELLLFVKTPQTEWVRQDSIPPAGTYFTPRVPQDGEYWFLVVTVDKSGKPTPADIAQASPTLKVIVDTQPPQLDVRPWTSADGELFLKCVLHDANPNYDSIRLTCRTSGGIDKTIEPVANQPGLFRRSNPEMQIFPMRVTASDLALNQITQDVNLKDLLASNAPSGNDPLPVTGTPIIPQAPPVGQNPPPVVVNTGFTNDGKPQPQLSNLKYELPPGPPLPLGDPSYNVQSPPPGPPPVAIAGAGAETLPKIPAVPGLPPSVSPVTADSLPKIPPLPGSTPISSPPSSPLASDVVPKVPAIPSSAPANRKVLSTAQATIDYRIDQVGPSGVGKVEVFVTSDQGQSWKRFKEDNDKRSPLDIDLPGEGLFGIQVVITNGNGFGGTPPRPGDAPSFWIEVDTTSPFVQLRPIDPAAATGGSLEIAWTASDKNLLAEPVSLFFRTRPDAPWQIIAQGLKNDGNHRWAIPRDSGAHFFFKVEVIDHAGNVGRTETANAVVLDMTEPRGVVVGVTGAGRSSNPQGN